jgi:hypothetical protein
MGTQRAQLHIPARWLRMMRQEIANCHAVSKYDRVIKKQCAPGVFVIIPATNAR